VVRSYSQWRAKVFCFLFFLGGGGVSTNSDDDIGQRERGSGGAGPLVRGSAQLSNE
jgi:hypothetical protein